MCVPSGPITSKLSMMVLTSGKPLCAKDSPLLGAERFSTHVPPTPDRKSRSC